MLQNLYFTGDPSKKKRREIIILIVMFCRCGRSRVKKNYAVSVGYSFRPDPENSGSFTYEEYVTLLELVYLSRLVYAARRLVRFGSCRCTVQYTRYVSLPVQCDQLSAYHATVERGMAFFYLFHTIHWPRTKTSLPPLIVTLSERRKTWPSSSCWLDDRLACCLFLYLRVDRLWFDVGGFF